MSVQLIQRYYASVEELHRHSGSTNERTIRRPFEELLGAYAKSKDLLLVSEIDLILGSKRRVTPDGVLKDALRQDWGYWESKDPKDDFSSAIDTKFAKGYPSNNILFENSQIAVLYQNGEEVACADFTDATLLDKLLTQFVSYESKELIEFHRAIQQFKNDIPALATELRVIIEEQYISCAAFQKTLSEFLELCRESINPNVEIADVREMVIQHILTEDIFMTVFSNPEFHLNNAIACRLQEVVGTFYSGAMWHTIHDRITPYYETIKARAAQIYNHHEKQKFLKILYESFYCAYNPKAADRLGVIYTPDEIVRFMIKTSEDLLFNHFDKTLSDNNIEILDPATGTGTFITELIEYIHEGQLEYKYLNEIHCNEIAILPYYIANLNIEYTYRQKTGKYLPFRNICFMDTLDNQGFNRSSDHQKDFFAIVDTNIERIQHQNERHISVIIGNPPYNANQLNENENNKNREYPDIDKLIKNTYIKNSKAQKTKCYDMYTRFIRWSTERLSSDGIIAFVSNNSFIDARAYDGFRKVIADEFNEVYIINMKGNARTSGEQRRREGGNVFSDQIRVGIAIYFLIRKEGSKGCKIFYNCVDDYLKAEAKKTFLREHKFQDLIFEHIHPDKYHNWINLVKNEWDELIPIGTKQTKFTKSDIEINALFKLYSHGVNTARDAIAYDFNRNHLLERIEQFSKDYNTELDRYVDERMPKEIDDFVNYELLKWSRNLKRHLKHKDILHIDEHKIRHSIYRPFTTKWLYFADIVVDELGHIQQVFPDTCTENENYASCITGIGSGQPFHCLATNVIPNFDMLEKTQCFSYYIYNERTGKSSENITDWALEKFQKHYLDTNISKWDIFNYTYAILHHPQYREKYAVNLKRALPHIPFASNFWIYSESGKILINLHADYNKQTGYQLQQYESNNVPSNWYIKNKMRLSKDKRELIYNESLTLGDIPPKVYEYRLGNRSALEHIVEQYRLKEDKRSGISSNPNLLEEPQYIVQLIGKVITVSLETVAIINNLPPLDAN